MSGLWSCAVLRSLFFKWFALYSAKQSVNSTGCSLTKLVFNILQYIKVTLMYYCLYSMDIEMPDSPLQYVILELVK